MSKPVVIVVMDGIGYNDTDNLNAVKHAYKPTLDALWSTCPHTRIKASGVAVGLPSDADMGNSEVGHNAIGCGQIYSQGAKLVNESIESGEIYQSKAWKDAVAYCKDHTLHFLGLLSDGNVHSNISHLIAMVKQAKAEGIHHIRVHILLDGRDTPETSALIYVDQLEDALKSLNDDTFDGKIASGGGRMVITMDRYEADWGMVEKGWQTHVCGEGRQFESAKEAIETYRNEGGFVDQYLPPFVIAENGQPVGTINDGDSVILFNFRGDRAIEISKAFDDPNFNAFVKTKNPKVYYCGMLQYDGDAKIPTNFLVEPPKIKDTLSQLLVENHVKSYAISETQKFGHVTYFWNGNRSEKFDENLEDWVEIPSDLVPFDQRPWMKSAEITDQLVEAIESGKYQFLRTNFPNGDMVGHTGDYEATIIGVESVDLCLKRIKDACDKAGAVLLITADHGNADEMAEKRKKDTDPIKPKTSHTLSLVPFIVYNGGNVELKDVEDGTFGLSNIAATIVDLLGIKPYDSWNETMIKH